MKLLLKIIKLTGLFHAALVIFGIVLYISGHIDEFSPNPFIFMLSIGVQFVPASIFEEEAR